MLRKVGRERSALTFKTNLEPPHKRMMQRKFLNQRLESRLNRKEK